MESERKRAIDWPAVWPQFMASVAVLAVLLTVTLAQGASIRADVAIFREEVANEVARVHNDVRSLSDRVDSLSDRVDSLSERVARIEGALTGPYRFPLPAAPAPAE